MDFGFELNDLEELFVELDRRIQAGLLPGHRDVMPYRTPSAAEIRRSAHKISAAPHPRWTSTAPREASSVSDAPTVGDAPTPPSTNTR